MDKTPVLEAEIQTGAVPGRAISIAIDSRKVRSEFVRSFRVEIF